MPLYFMLLDSDTFDARIRPPLAAGWRQRSFQPCRALCESLLPAAADFARRYHLGSAETILTQVVRGLPFDRHCWTLLVGEILFYAAAELPELQVAPETLTALLAPGAAAAEGAADRERPPILQCHYGTRELTFGVKPYLPDHVGLNDRADVRRLRAYLDGLRPDEWDAAQFAALPELAEEEREEELAFARQCFDELHGLYVRAKENGHVVVCEDLAPAPVD
jgi:hypothetical protein